MVGALAPLAIVLGGTVAVVLMFSSFWERIAGRARGFGSVFRQELDIADVHVKPEDLGFTVLSAVAIAWIAAVMILRPSPLIGAFYLVALLGFSAYAVRLYLKVLVRRRVKAFREQFEGVTRALASAVRVGLGLRQALIFVAERSKDPAHKELTRAVGKASLGSGIFDALDELAVRLPTPEVAMLARVVRVQATSGGDLAGVLEGLADTIRDRRRLDRRVRVLTMQARASAWVIGALPLVLLAFILFTQPDLRVATLDTTFGHLVLFLGVGLDGLAGAILFQMTRFDA